MDIGTWLRGPGREQYEPVKTKRAHEAIAARPVMLTPLRDLAILEEDKHYLEMRMARLDTGMARAEDPPSRNRHLIGNLEAVGLESGEVEAKTAFLVYRSHLETDHQLLSGCRQDLLRKANYNPLDLIEARLVGPAIVKLRRPPRGMVRHRRGFSGVLLFLR